MRRSASIVLSAASILGGASCAAPVVIASAGFGALQTGTEAFIRGELEAAVVHPMEHVFQAAQDAMTALNFPSRGAKMGEANAYVLAKEVQGRKIDINLQMKSKNVTKINIRVGVFGDQAVSRLILAEIQEKLGPHPSHADVPPPE